MSSFEALNNVLFIHLDSILTHIDRVCQYTVFSHTQTQDMSVYVSPCPDSCTQMATESFHQSTAICSDSNGTFREIRQRWTDRQRDEKRGERETREREINCTDKWQTNTEKRI